MFIVKVPGINGKKSKGCERAGNAILEKLREIHSNEQGKIIDVDFLDLEEIHLDNENLELTNKLIYKNAFEIFEEKPRVVFLGGDHSVSFSLTRAFLDYCENSSEEKDAKEPYLIVFDAHADCRDFLKREEFPMNREWLRGIIEKGFPKENIILVGVRNIEKQELEFLNKNKIKIISMNQLLENLEDSCDVIMEFVSGKNKEVYVSIDVDVMDPAFAPATGYAEPGGLTSRDFIYLIQRINKLKNLKALDLVEINSEKDKEKFDELTIKLGAKILGEVL